MPFEEGKFWDQPSSYRLLKGLLTTALKYSELYAGSVFADIGYRDKNVNLFFNCKYEEIGEILKNPIAPDMFEFGGSQNLMEFMFSYETPFDLQSMISDTRSWNSSSSSFLDSLGINNGTQGTFKHVKDPAILDQLDKSGLHVPGISKN